jgi:tetratricopeptide (TPR) repeat protein
VTEDPVIEAWLARGIVSAGAVRHARAIVRRGFPRMPVAHMLVELERVGPEHLPAPDETQPVPEKVPTPGFFERWLPKPTLPAPEVLPVRRLVHAILLRHRRPGEAFRIEAWGEPGRVLTSRASRFDDVFMEPPRKVLVAAIEELRSMANLAAGSTEGAFVVDLEKGAHLGFRAYFANTERGPSVVVVRQISWFGHGLPHEPVFAKARLALGTEFKGSALPAMRAFLVEADAIGSEGVVEQVTARLFLSQALMRIDAEREAAAAAEEATAIAEANDLGPRALGLCIVLRAAAELSDLKARAARFEHAAEHFGAPGIGRPHATSLDLERAITARLRGEHDAAASAAERALAADQAWFGATSAQGVRARVESALAHAARLHIAKADDARADMGQVDGLSALREAREAERIAVAIQSPMRHVDWAVGVAAHAIGRTLEATVALMRAHESKEVIDHDAPDGADVSDAPFIALALIRTLDAGGRRSDAAAIAREVLSRPLAGLGQHARAELEAVAARTPYR